MSGPSGAPVGRTAGSAWASAARGKWPAEAARGPPAWLERAEDELRQPAQGVTVMKVRCSLRFMDIGLIVSYDSPSSYGKAHALSSGCAAGRDGSPPPANRLDADGVLGCKSRLALPTLRSVGDCPRSALAGDDLGSGRTISIPAAEARPLPFRSTPAPARRLLELVADLRAEPLLGTAELDALSSDRDAASDERLVF